MRQPRIPRLWLVSDARNDAGLEAGLARLPRGAGLIFRHYHLDPAARRARFESLARLAAERGITLVLSGNARQSRRWGGAGAYAAPQALGRPTGGLRLATAHDLRELAAARRARADAVLLSPVFATRSHPGSATLGPLRFLLLARRAGLPVIALGGMTAKRARRLPIHGWAAIDGLSRHTLQSNAGA